jgi:hypothetical protein
MLENDLHITPRLGYYGQFFHLSPPNICSSYWGQSMLWEMEKYFVELDC